MSALTNIFTGKDNQTHDIARVTWFISLIAVIAWAFIYAEKCTLTEFGLVLGGIAVAGAGSVWGKRETEPQ